MKQKTASWMISILTAALIGFLAGSCWGRAQNLNVLPSAKAQERLEVPSRAGVCALGLLQGAYAFSAEGRAQSGGTFAAEPYATVGIATFDGQGKLTLSVTQSVGGTILPPFPVTGVYGLNESCGGRMTLSTGAIFDLVISNNGREIALIQINSGNVVHGHAKKL